jgi:alanyl aminopeptidase
VHVEYRGENSRRDEHGLFTQDEDGAAYALTDMEPIYAWRVFPCFDEPSFKVPWTRSLTVREELVALDNGPVLSESHLEPAGTGRGVWSVDP